MKLKRKNIIILAIASICLIGLIIGIVIFVDNFKKDQKKTLEIVKNIKEEYKNFSPYTETFSEKRNKFYSLKEETMYLESFGEVQEEFITFLEEYNTFINEVDEKNEYLKNHCQRKYSDGVANNKCELFKQGYEAIMNYYITDIKVYNDFVDIYNKWLEENGEEASLSKKELTLYSDYIDYDKDGKYLGGE